MKFLDVKKKTRPRIISISNKMHIVPKPKLPLVIIWTAPAVKKYEEVIEFN